MEWSRSHGRSHSCQHRRCVRACADQVQEGAHRYARRSIVRPTKYPDLDNIVKAVIDACKKIVMRDDVQVVDIRARKRYGSNFRVDVVISPAVLEPAGELESVSHAVWIGVEIRPH
ncbi:RusA family crossover junction endodeoxyribonuclease [Brevundimonas sp. SL161]|uniref:RusA family crossover junction endodeoxyribonuclease n=1 Tax=Brevundimonas sp. SL161 TaxID=2804613 RepID=UPI003CF98C72